MIVVLIGPPGSGKGTQSDVISIQFNLPILSIGDMFREIAMSDEPESELINKYMKEGKLIPSILVNRVIEKFLSSEKYKDGCVLDGYPRTLDQGIFLQEIINHQSILAIYFNIDSQLVKERILGRFFCKNCKKIYNTKLDGLKVRDGCDSCGASDFTYRNDDEEKIINERIATYKAETYPLIDYYNKLGILHHVDASKTKEEVSEFLLDIVKKV